MKNVHLLPTSKPSKLCVNGKNQHIYITSDEEIKERDWCYDKVLNLIFQTSINYML